MKVILLSTRETFWNIRSANPLSYPPAASGPTTMNPMGLHTKQPPEVAPEGKWFEAIPPAVTQPQDLHAAQWRRRLGTRCMRCAGYRTQ